MDTDKCKHGVSAWGGAPCYNCVIEENEKLKEDNQLFKDTIDAMQESHVARAVTEETVKSTLEIFEKKLREKIEEKGPRAFYSYHEALGVVAEEYMELIQAVQSNDPEKIKEELLDVAVSSIWGVASKEGLWL